MTKKILTILGVALGIVLLVGVSIGFKWLDVTTDRIIFKESITYNESMASFLAKSYKEYNECGTEDGRNAIMEYVVNRYPNIDVSKIENYELKNFYNKCLTGGN